MTLRFITFIPFALVISFFSVSLYAAPVTPVNVVAEEEPAETSEQEPPLFQTPPYKDPSYQQPSFDSSSPELTDIEGEELVDIPLPERKPKEPPRPPVRTEFTINKTPKRDRWSGRDMAQIPPGVCGSFTYNPRGGKPDLRWSYANVTSGCAYMALLQKWNKACDKMQPSRGVKQSGCRVAQGHISKRKSFGYGAHSTHTHGYCFDLRPFRKKGFKNSPLTMSQRAYSRNFTKKFLKMARKFGSDTTYFNDRKIINSGLSSKEGGHHNHIHICFKPGPGTRRACKRWKPDPNICPRAGGWVKMLKKRGLL